VSTGPNKGLLLKQKFTLVFENHRYRKLSNGFQLGPKLDCIVEDDLIKFRSLSILSRIIDTSEIFKDATDSEVQSFANQHSDLFHVIDSDRFIRNTNQTARKLITSLMNSDVLKGKTVQYLQDAAGIVEKTLDLENEKIVIPESSKEITNLMKFLNDNFYVGPVSKKSYEINSKRSVKP